MLVLVREGDALVRASDLEEAGLHDLAGRREVVEGSAWLSLASLAPALSFKVDEKAPALRITAAPQLLPKSLLDLGRARPPDVRVGGKASAFLNYAFQLTDRGQLSSAAEVGASFRSALLTSSVSRSPDGSLSRGLTNLVLDAPERLQRWVLGDALAGATAVAGELGGSALLGGVSVAREFSLDPYFVRSPLPRAAGTVLSPSTLEVYVDGVLVKQQALDPGTFELKNIPVTAGAGSVSYLLRDAFGRTQEVASPYYFSPSVLAPGLSEYGYAAGFRRVDFPRSNFAYRGLAFLGHHRLGVTDWLTAGARLEAARDVVSGGGAATVRLPFGDVQFSGAASGSPAGGGTGATLGYGLLLRTFSLSALLKIESARYATVSLDPGDDRPTLQLNLSGGLPLGARVGLSAGYVISRFRDRGISEQVSVRATAQLARNFSAFVSVGRSRETGGTAAPEFFLSLAYSPQAGLTADAFHLRRPGATDSGVQLSKAAPAAEGIGYRVSGHTGEEQGAAAFLQARASFGSYEASLQQTGAQTAASVSAAGALVAVDGAVFATRPVEQGYALLQVPGVGGVRAYLENLEIGRTNARGDLLIPNLTPYYANRLRIADEDIPFSYQIDRVEQIVAAPFRGAAVAPFPVRPIASVAGTVFIEEGGTRRIPAYGEITVAVAGKKIVSPIGRDGEFYLDRIPVGPHEAVIEDAKGACRFLIHVTAGKPGVEQLGSLGCVGDKEVRP